VEPLAARLTGDPDETEAVHAKLLWFLKNSEWSDAGVRKYAATYAIAQMQKRHPISHWLVDDTGFLKQGKHSPGVKRQYTGSAGKVANAQVAVSLTVSNEHEQLPLDMMLYLPEDWAADIERRRDAKIPDTVVFKPKWKLALDMIEATLAVGVPRGVVLADADYGEKTEFRDRLEELGLTYAVGVHSTTMVRRVRGKGSSRRHGKRMSVKELAFSIEEKDIRKITWREGTNAPLSSQFAVLRVESMHRDDAPRAEQWLVIEWPDGSDTPTHYTLATLPSSLSRRQLVRHIKERWRTERVYQDLKGELGLDHFEGRTYTGWNHHVTIVLACFASLVAEHARLFPPAPARTQQPTPHRPLRDAA
jgi:SRSO17 transposase